MQLYTLRHKMSKVRGRTAVRITTGLKRAIHIKHAHHKVETDEHEQSATALTPANAERRKDNPESHRSYGADHTQPMIG